jgi:hypothetical protein
MLVLNWTLSFAGCRLAAKVAAMSVVANLLAAMRIRWRVRIPAARWPEFEHYIQRQHRPSCC